MVDDIADDDDTGSALSSESEEEEDVEDNAGHTAAPARRVSRQTAAASAAAIPGAGHTAAPARRVSRQTAAASAAAIPGASTLAGRETRQAVTTSTAAAVGGGSGPPVVAVAPAKVRKTHGLGSDKKRFDSHLLKSFDKINQMNVDDNPTDFGKKIALIFATHQKALMSDLLHRKYKYCLSLASPPPTNHALIMSGYAILSKKMPWPRRRASSRSRS